MVLSTRRACIDDAIGCSQQTLDAVATHSLNVDEGDGITVGGHQLGLHTVGGAEPVDGPALGLEAIGHGQAREHMAPGTACHHQQCLAHETSRTRAWALA